SIIGAISALIYIVSPIDMIPDLVPGIGYIDDLAVLGFAMKMIDSDVQEYKNWRKERGKQIIAEI
ncbi:MAG: DUF1232 domain-containing protein, partial [Clostridiales bacterium]|nr:DUF1232 domain-containing protein [Clostridiales bacterium]